MELRPGGRSEYTILHWGLTVAIAVQYPCRILSYIMKPGEVGSPLQVRSTVLFVSLWALSWSDEGLNRTRLSRVLAEPARSRPT